MMFYKKLIALVLLIFCGSVLSFAEEEVQELKKVENIDAQKQLDMINQIQESIRVGKPIDMINQDVSSTVVEGGVEKTRSMSLDDCIRLALLNNPAIQAAISNKEIYKSRIGQAWSAYFPTLSLGLNYSRNRALEKHAHQYNLYSMPGIEASQLIYDFGKTRAATNIAKKTFEASDDNLQATINDTIYNVKEAYYNLLFAIQEDQVYADTVANYEAHLEQAQNYYNIGTKPKIDVITAQYNLGNAKLNLIKSKHNIDIAYAKLNNAMGLPEQVGYSIDEKFELPIQEFVFNELLEKAKTTRPELLAAEKKADASKILIKASRVAFLPDVRLFGGYTSGGTKMTDTYSFQFGGGLQYQATNLYLLKKQVDEAKATYKRDAAELEQANQGVYLDVKAALINFDNAKESIPVAKLALLNAKEQHALASGRYKTGLSDVIELKDAEITYLNAQLEYYSTLLNYNIAYSNLERVVGTNLSQIQE